MYADRYTRPGGINPGSLGMAVGINVALVAALLLANPEVTRILADPPITTYNVPPEKTPDPIPPEVKPDTRVPPVEPRISVDPPIVERPAETSWTVPTYPPQPPMADPGPGIAGGTGTLPVDPPKPPPVLTAVGVDPRYAGLFQPPYPPAEQRAGRAGRVVVRVLVGADGRVKQVERVLATSDAFFRVTEQRALSQWRFTPATRDGVPVEGWKQMNVTFVLNDE